MSIHCFFFNAFFSTLLVLSISVPVKAQINIEITIPMTPPGWALLERELLGANTQAIEEFYGYFYDKRGYLLHKERYDLMNGPDDCMDAVCNWTLLHSLGASDSVLILFRNAYEGHIQQFTAVKSDSGVAKNGCYYKEFPVQADFFHTGEGLRGPIFWGLSEPNNTLYQKRMRRFSGFYINEDPDAPNYDPKHKIIRSHRTGSRGPMLRDGTNEDWAGEPISGKFYTRGSKLIDYGEYYKNTIKNHSWDLEFEGDNPLNMIATNLVLHAYMLAHEEKYKNWILEYVDAWKERTITNGGNIPTNVSLDGTIGGEFEGKWYKGNNGWNNSKFLPYQNHDGLDISKLEKDLSNWSHYNYFSCGLWTGFGNAYMLTGDQGYLDILRRQTENIFAQKKIIDGKEMIPFNYGEFLGETGWYNYRDITSYSIVGWPKERLIQLYMWSMDRKDLKYVKPTPWLDFLDGKNPGYPEQALQKDFANIKRKIEMIRKDPTTPDTRLADWAQNYNPATTQTLVNLMLGGYLVGTHWTLNSYIRYFDPVRNRAGIPEDVAALVTKMDKEMVRVILVNINQVESHDIIVQTGGYGEHQCVRVETEGKVIPVNNRFFNVRLSPGAGAELVIYVSRYANQPTLAFPWHGESIEEK